MGATLGVALLAAVGALAPHTVASGAQTHATTSLAAARIKLKQVATGLDSPVAMAWRAGKSTPIYVAQQTGSVVTVGSSGHITGTALRLTALSQGNEEGLLGIAFSNDGTKLYVDFTDTTGDIHVVEYTMKGNVANVATRRPLLTIPHHTFENHNGGNLVVGADNMLYISVGDGGGAGDTLKNGQNLDSLLAKILRIDPTPNGAAAYTIPADNPFVNTAGARPEIWMWGLRNPWRFSFDRLTHDTWIGDVGQNAYEEVDYAPAGQSGINWGWSKREGFHPYNGGTKPDGAQDPILERTHDDGDCAVIGGYVYRGKAIASFNGAYVFGDECTGELRAIVQSGGKVPQRRDLHLNVDELTSFGEGPSGGIFAASRAGKLFLLAPR
jgi:glucose/arabinose dehydrogenase